MPSNLSLGRLSELATKKVLLIALVIVVAVSTLPAYRAWHNTSMQCVSCHGNKELMAKLGFQSLYVTPEDVRRQSKHADIECRDCHLGNGRATDKDKAHKGMLKALIINEHAEVMDRKKLFKGPLLPSGDNKIFELLPKVTENNELTVPAEVRNVLWHDRNTETFNFDPDIVKKTCSKSNCHPQALQQFKKTVMGINYRQRFMKTWTQPAGYGPHNCGPSFADLPATDELKGAGFDYKNTDEIGKNLNVPFSKHQAEDKQKFCNVCHAGCLDCHYTPSKKEGVHSITRVPRPETCSGSGRSTSICHPGAMMARRGETYIGGDYSIPSGMPPDVHYKKGITCVDCHPVGEKGMGDIERKAVCQDCHIEIEDAHAKGIHKNLDCASCHISALGGYQLTIWGPGVIAGSKNPFKKYSLYYGIQQPPILAKDINGTWRPYKIWPHSVGNIKNDVPASPCIQFRWPKGETNDAYYIVGTFDNLPGNNKHLLWIQFDQASHSFGKSRTCDSCHASERQVSYSTWEFYDNYGAYPFNGQHSIEADSKGLAIVGLKNTTVIELMEGFKPTDFASWLYLKDAWKMPGNFAIKTDAKLYKQYITRSNQIEDKLKSLEKQLPALSKEALKKLKAAKGAALHNVDDAGALGDNAP
ncbi:MAG: cytochrome c3 family protein [Nitrospirae bacterium]|nr:cytochrome c3 family protein [Nitrospirota bacterium]